MPKGPGFAGDPPERADVVVVGGGISGTSTALHLARGGVDVTLLERGSIGRGATGAAVGVLSPPLRQPFHQTVHFRGEEQARTIWEFALRSVAGLGGALREMGAAERVGLDLSGGYVLAERHTLAEVERSQRALQRAGLPVRWITEEAVEGLVNGRGFCGGFVIEGGGAVSPAPAAVALAEGARSAGARIVENADVQSVVGGAGGFRCRTSRGEVHAAMVVYATHVDCRRFSAFLGDEVVPIRGQAMRARPGAVRFRGAFATHGKLNVWRSAPDGSLMLGGWRTDAWDRSYWKMKPKVDDRLQSDVQHWFEATVRQGAPLDVEERWSGIFGWTADYLPMVGPLPGRAGELVVAGFSGGGLPFAFEAGRAAASIVAGADPVPGADLLNPRRFT